MRRRRLMMMGKVGRSALAAAAMALLGSTSVPPQQAPDAPARPAVDAPELAKLGGWAVGVTEEEVVQPRQVDPVQGGAIADRHLPLTIWYPAAAAGPGTTYHTALSGENGVDVPFDVPGLATPGVAVARGRFPLVILAHGYGNTPAVLSWLGENLASKGYLVVAPAFRDPPISIRTAAARSGPIARRPLDIAFVAAAMQRQAREGRGVIAAADTARVALIGYSMGGYGALTAAGAPLAAGMAAASGGALGEYVAGARRAAELTVPHVKAVVAISPANRLGDAPVWAPDGLAAVTTPTLFVVGSQDHVVGYDPGVRSLFEGEVNARRYLLTFKEAGHSIALIGAPPAMRHGFWDLDWFEDAVWRKDRLLPIEAHFITAFLDRYVKGDAQKGAYLDGLAPDADTTGWPSAPVGRYAGYSPGAPTTSVWKGFQPSRHAGLMFEARGPQ
jgi:predicted dienelactone hydrolase